MNACDKARQRLDAYIDNELDDAARAEVALHVEGCKACHQELRELEGMRDSLKEQFTTWIAEAPTPPPTVLDRSHTWPPAALAATPPHSPARARSKTRSIVMKSLTGIAAILLLTLTIYFLIPGEQVIASPAELIQRAAEKYLSWKDVELEISVHLKGMEFLARLSEEDDLDPEDLAGKLRILMLAPHYVLANPEGSKKGFPLVDGLFGFDGNDIWTYDAEKKVVHLGDADSESSSFSFTYSTSTTEHSMKFKKDTNFMQFLSWDFMKQLDDNTENLEIIEVTGPYDSRVERRVFEVHRSLDDDETDEGTKKEKSFLEKMFWTRSRITIDPEEGLVERYELDLKLSFISLLSFKVEVVDVNQGYDVEYFHWSAHVPEGTSVIDAPPPAQNEEGEEAGEEESAGE